MRSAFFLFCLCFFFQHGQAQFFSENFDDLVPALGQQIPEGWTAENLNNDNAFWDVLPNSATFPNNARSAPNAIHMSFDIDDSADDWLFSPALSLTKNMRYTIRFWYRNIDTGFNTSEKLKVQLSTAANSTAIDPTPIFVDSMINNMSYELAEFSFVAIDSGTYFLGFHCFSDPFQFLLAFDDLEIEESLVNAIADVSWGKEIRAFPNPTSDQIQFQIPADYSKLQLQIFNEQGVLVIEKNQLVEHNQFSLETLSSGIYAYLIRDNQGHSISGRFTFIK